jgi:hypothetical protein
MHAQNDIDYLKQIDKVYSSLNEKCLCTPCFNAALKYAEKLNTLYETVNDWKNAKLDCDDYRPGSVVRQRRCQEAKFYLSLIPAFYKEAADANAAVKNKCAK